MEMKMACCFGVVMVMMVMSSYGRVGAVTCPEATLTLLPCVPYLAGPAKEPGSPCCSAAAKVIGEADTKEERKSLCECLKKAAASFKVNPDKAKQLPQLCHIQTPVPIDPNVDCSSIKLVTGGHF